MEAKPFQQIKLRMPVGIHAALKAVAAQQQRSVNWIVNSILAKAVKQEAKQ